MFAHVTIRAEERAASECFYRTVLHALGIEPNHSTADITAWDGFAILGADPEHPAARHLHVAFVARSREHVDAFWRAGVDAGYEDAGGSASSRLVALASAPRPAHGTPADNARQSKPAI